MIWIKPVESSQSTDNSRQHDNRRNKDITESFKEFLNDLRMEQQEQM